jgi:hypothetical protein
MSTLVRVWQIIRVYLSPIYVIGVCSLAAQCDNDVIINAESLLNRGLNVTS